MANHHIPSSIDALYEELQALDYLNEFTPAQQARYNFLENLLPQMQDDEEHARYVRSLADSNHIDNA